MRQCSNAAAAHRVVSFSSTPAQEATARSEAGGSLTPRKVLPLNANHANYNAYSAQSHMARPFSAKP